MKKFFFLLLSAFTLNAGAQTFFQRTFGSIDHDHAASVVQTSDGGFVLAGQYAGTSLCLVRIDANGDTLWTSIYDTLFSPYFYSVRQTADSGFIIGCTVGNLGAGQYDACLIKTDANGNTSWIRTFGQAIDQWGCSAEQTADGGYILVGASYTSGFADVYLVKTDAGGILQWVKKIGGADEEWGYSVQEVVGGGYIITGFTYSFSGNGLYLVRTDSGGNIVWSKTYDSSLSNSETGYCVRQTSDGGYVITGELANNLFLAKTDSSGNLSWEKTLDALAWGTESGRAVQQTADGGYIVAGSMMDSVNYDSTDVLLIKTDAGGAVQWAKKYGGSGNEIAYAVQQTNDGGYVLTGSTNSFGAGGTDMYLIKTDAQGNAGCLQAALPVVAASASITAVAQNSLTATGATTMGHALATYAGGTFIDVCMTVDVRELVRTGKVNVFPNPASSVVHVDASALWTSDANDWRLVICDVTGRQMESAEIKSPVSAMSCAGFPAGMYFWKLVSGQGTLGAGKLLIE